VFTVVERNPYKTPRAAPPTPAAARSTILSLQSFQTINGLEPERVGFVDRSFFLFLSFSQTASKPSRFSCRFLRASNELSQPTERAYVLLYSRFASRFESPIRVEPTRRTPLFVRGSSKTNRHRQGIHIYIFFYLRRLDGSGGLTLAVCRPTHESAQGNIVERNRETDRKKPRQMAESGAGCYPERTEDRSRG
jgi:hypothetical protein